MSLSNSAEPNSRPQSGVDRISPLPRPVPPPGEAPGEAPAGDAPPQDVAPTRPPIVKRLVLLTLLLALLGTGASYGWHWWTDGRFLVSTDDAYVEADFAIVAPKISGYVAEVSAKANMAVRAGDPLVRLEAGDYQVELRTAEAAIAAQKAVISRLASQVEQALAKIDVARAESGAVRATVTQAEADYRRYNNLAHSDFASKQRLESARATLETARANLAARTAEVAEAEAALHVAIASQAEAEAELSARDAARDRAARDLDAAVIRAPFDGAIGNLAVSVGDYVQPGSRLLAVVPLGEVYIDANFKETQLPGLVPGTEVDIHIDAYPDRHFTAMVVGFAPATGSMFSLLPPENATGNFTKVVQRVPVRIAVPAEIAAQGWLRPGLSVVVTADTRTVAGAPTGAQN